MLHPLVANAVKFTSQGEVRVRLERADEDVAIRVSDTGCGIAPEVLPQLFEAFSQGDASIRRGYSGAGLGLALASRHVRRMGGRIEVDSRPGSGSTFSIQLPLARLADGPEPVVPAEPAVAAASPEPRRTEPAVERAPRVLVVDDHPVNREVARIMLGALGCEVIEACDGLEALDRVQSAPLDLVLMDVRMPRMDGLEATRRIRAMGGEPGTIAIVAMTADAMPEDVERCLGAGMNAHLAKPISQAALWDAVSRALSGALPGDRTAAAA